MFDKRIFIVFSAMAFLCIFVVLPWQQIQNNGTGDAVNTYISLGYAPIWAQPNLAQGMLADTIQVARSVQPDWGVLGLELSILALILWFVRPIGMARKGKPEASSQIKPATFDLDTLKITTRTLTGIGLLVCLSLMLMAGLVLKLKEMNEWTMHTYQVIDEIKTIGTVWKDWDREQRIDSRRSNNDLLMQHYQKARAMTLDNPVQQNNFKDLSAIISTHDVPQGDFVRRHLDLHLAKMVRVEMDLLNARMQTVGQIRNRLWLCVAALSILILVALIWIARFINNAVRTLKREIDERIKTEDALKISTANLERSNNDLQQFAFIASHDLQEPLRAVTGFLNLLERHLGDKLDADGQKYIGFAVDGAKRMRALIDDLLAYARIETREMKTSNLNLPNILKEVQSDLGEQIAESGARIEINEKIPEIRGDETQIRQLLQNLISNSIKFRGSEKPLIRIEGQRQDDKCLLKICDNGRGFKMEHAERIFVIFQRLQTRDHAPGTGIGLALCKKIVERHGGQIWVESEPNKGTTFLCTLPLAT